MKRASSGPSSGDTQTHIRRSRCDLFLSNTVRVHRKLRAAGATADLLVFEGVAHADYVQWADTPESLEAFDALKKFVMEHLD